MVSKSLKIQHFVSIPRLKSQIATVRDHLNRIQIYFIEQAGPIYKRNGLNQSWERLTEQDQQRFNGLISHPDNVGCPRYSTDNINEFNLSFVN